MAVSAEKRTRLREKLMKMMKTDDPFVAITKLRYLFEDEDRGVDELPPDVDPIDAVDTARWIYEQEDSVQIDEDATFSVSNEGMWVSAWVWLDWDDIEAVSGGPDLEDDEDDADEGDDIPAYLADELDGAFPRVY